jgi:WD40 repeat protein
LTLQAGARLGPYEVVSLLGSGGMGEVYRARDTKLGRDVALKVLPDAVASDPERLARFEREAQVLAALNHPNIAHIHGFEDSSAKHALVMELVEGPTLADWIAQGPIPLAEALPIARQIAEAFDAAHELGVVHRDLKPANIMLTKSGAKLLDFGLAKVTPAVVAASGLSIAPTGITPVTMQGTLLGTLQYMAPEQVEGAEAHARSDLFAFGAILYEMVTGTRAFEGKSQASVIAAILEREPPPMSSLQPLAPAALDRVVRKCLAKDGAERWQSAKDLHDELLWLSEGNIGSARVAPAARTPGGAYVGWVVAALATLAALAVGFTAMRRPASEAPLIRFDLEMSSAPNPLHLTVSPDGKYVSAIVGSDKGSVIWLRAMNEPSARTLPGTEGAAFPFGPPQTLCDASNGHGGTWNRDGVILFAPAQTGPLFRVSAGGGVPVQVTTLAGTRQDFAHRHPYFLPDGVHFLYTAVAAKPEESEIVVASLGSMERKPIVRSAMKAAFGPPDGLFFVRQDTFTTAANLIGTLMVQRFDVKNLNVIGDASPLTDRVGINNVNSAAGFAVSNNGVLAFRTGNTDHVLTWFDRSGKQLGAIERAPYISPALSPDGEQIAFARVDAGAHVWIHDQARGTTSRFTFDPASDDIPVWSPDGKSVIFSSVRGGQFGLYEKSVGGASQEELLLKSDRPIFPEDWSADGRFVLYTEQDPKTNDDLWILPLVGDRKPRAVVNSPFAETQGRFSPDGRWIAYASNESGQTQVYIQGLAPLRGKWQVSNGASYQPRWRRDGKELFFLTGAAGLAQVMATTVDATASEIRAGVPHLLFRAAPESVGTRRSWDVAPDGQRFLVNSNPESVVPPVSVVVNWNALAHP